MLIVSLSLNQTLLILFLFGGFNWFWQFLCEGLSSFNPKGFCYSYSWSCGICEGKTSFCTRLISRKLCRFRFLLVFSAGFTSLSVLLLFPELIMFFLSLCMVFDSILSNIDEVLSINPSANVFLFGDFHPHHQDWLTYSGWPVELLEFFCFKWPYSDGQLSFLDRLTVTLKLLLSWISFFCLRLEFVL